MNNSRLIRGSVVLLSVLAMSACDDPFQTIEELTFAESLGIVLSDFTRLDSGVYIKDVVVGSGDLTAEGQTAVLEYTGYLANGTSFGNGTFPFVIGSGSTIAGFELGVFGMRAGGQRRLIIP
ncbi:MAG: FKBP-type peptidyl-prolyl cis-trans isomerase, partial [Longimicrobiales bacterium]